MPLPATVFPKKQARVARGAIVANSLLAGALCEIEHHQQVRAAAELKERITERDRQLLQRQAATT